jgi:hypothetical protein
MFAVIDGSPDYSDSYILGTYIQRTQDSRHVTALQQFGWNDILV